jgi:hypothetical protein
MVRLNSRILGMLWRYAARLRAARNQVLAERLLDSLPLDLRKDIGWPDGCFDSDARVEWNAQSADPAIARHWPDDQATDRGDGRARRPRLADAAVVPLRVSAKRHSVPMLRTRKAPAGS